MYWLVIENDKECNINAIEMLGGTDKKGGTNFIGKFGSGFKYAICAALRNKIDIRICAGDKIVKFNTVPVDIGRTTVDRITMQIGNNTPKDRDWTTQLGSEDWQSNSQKGVTVEWMIFRELFSNALDEGGTVNRYIATKLEPEAGKTKIYIRLTDEVRKVNQKIGDYFPRYVGRIAVEENIYGRVYETKAGARGSIYCRGVFIREMPKNLMFDYDLTFPLTESRTVEPSDVQWCIAKFLKYCSPKFINAFLSKLYVGGDYFENDFPAEYISFNSDVIQNSFKELFGEHSFLCPDLNTLPQGIAESLSGKNKVFLPAPWRESMVRHGVSDYLNVICKDRLNGYVYLNDNHDIDPRFVDAINKCWNYCLKFFADALNKKGSLPKLRYFKWEGDPNKLVLGNCYGEYIGMNSELPINSTNILHTMLEEFAHFVSDAPDFSRELLESITRAIAINAAKNNEI